MVPRIQYAKTKDDVTDIKGGKVKAGRSCKTIAVRDQGGALARSSVGYA